VQYWLKVSSKLSNNLSESYAGYTSTAHALDYGGESGPSVVFETAIGQEETVARIELAMEDKIPTT